MFKKIWSLSDQVILLKRLGRTIRKRILSFAGIRIFTVSITFRKESTIAAHD